MEKHITEDEKTTKEFWGKHNLVLLVQSQNSTTSETQAVYLFLKKKNIYIYLQMTCGCYSVKIQYNNSPEKDTLFTLKYTLKLSDTYTITP